MYRDNFVFIKHLRKPVLQTNTGRIIGVPSFGQEECLALQSFEMLYNPAHQCETDVLFDVVYTPNGATDVAEFIPFGSTATNGVVRFGYGVAAAQAGMATIPARLDTATPKIQYKVTSGDTLTLLVNGFKDILS